MNIIGYLVTWGDPSPPPPEPISESDDEMDSYRSGGVVSRGATRGSGAGTTRGISSVYRGAAPVPRSNSNDDMSLDTVNSIKASELNFAFKSVTTGEVTPLQNVAMNGDVKSTLESILPTSRILKPYKRSIMDGRMLQLNSVLSGEQTFGSCGNFSSMRQGEVATGDAVMMTATQLACISGKWLENNSSESWRWASDHQFQAHGVLTESADRIKYNKRVHWIFERVHWKNMRFDPSVSVAPDDHDISHIVNANVVGSSNAGFSRLPDGSCTKKITARQILRVIPIVSNCSMLVYANATADECCVCFDTGGEMCTNLCGHQVCATCAPRLQKCPLCRASWTSLPSHDPTPIALPIFSCANHKIGAVLFDISSPFQIRGVDVETKLVDIMGRWASASDAEIDDFKLCIKKLCGINPMDNMRGIKHTGGDCLVCYTPLGKKVFVHQEVRSRKLQLFLLDMTNASPYTGFNPLKLHCVRQMQSALRNATGTIKKMRSPANLPLTRSSTTSYRMCDNCQANAQDVYYQDIDNGFDLCVPCYATLRWVESCYRWDGTTASIAETAAALAGDSDASNNDEDVEKYLKQELAPRPVAPPRKKYQPLHPARFQSGPVVRIEEWGQHLDQIGTELLQCESTLCENRKDPVAHQEQATKILNSLEATIYNNFVVHTDIGMTAFIRQSLVAHMEKKHAESGSKVDEFGGVDMRLCMQGKQNRKELLDILKNTLDHTGAPATPKQCAEIDLFVNNIVTLLPESVFDLILRRSEPPPFRVENNGLHNSDEASDSGLCIQFHRDESKFTMAIPLNTGGDGCEGGRVVYVTTTGFEMPQRSLDSLTIHDDSIAHGITTHSKGVRYGMFLLSKLDECVER